MGLDTSMAKLELDVQQLRFVDCRFSELLITRLTRPEETLEKALMSEFQAPLLPQRTCSFPGIEVSS